MRVFLVEDHLVFRDSLRIALESDGLTVVGVAAGGRELFAAMPAANPDVLVVDLLLNDTDGVALLRELKRRRMLVNALLLTRISHPMFIEDAFAAGALGYCPKEAPLQELVNAIKAVGRGERYVADSIAQVLTQASGTSEADPDLKDLHLLSPREREVFCRLLQGESSKQIAAALCVSVRTVDSHRLEINRKLGVRSPTQLARIAALHRLLPG